MKVLRWIFCIPLAWAIAIGLIYFVVVNSDAYVVQRSNNYIYLAFHVFEIVFTFAMLVFLSSLFAPRPKKYAALITVVTGICLVIFAFYLQFMNILGGNVSLVFISSMLGLLAGLSIGLVVCYYVFKNRSWNPLPIKPELEIIETY